MENNQVKEYTWAADAELDIKGKEFEILYINLLNYVNSPVPTSPIAISRVLDCFTVAKELLNRYIETGKIQENPKEDIKETTTIEL